MDDFLTKPVKLADLEAVLARWVKVPASDSPVAPHPAPAPSPGAHVLDPEVLAGLRELETDGEPSALDPLVVAFLRDARGRLRLLRTTIAESDMERAAGIAHSLRGSSANLGASGMAALCSDAEAAARDGDPDAATRVLEQLDAEFELVEAALRAAFPGAGASG